MHRFALISGLLVLASALGLSLPAPSAAGRVLQGPTLLISEVLVNSGEGSRDAAFEWVELHNPNADPLSLEGWSIADNTDMDLLPAEVVVRGGFVILAASEAVTFDATASEPTNVPIVLIDDGRLGNGLANNGDRIVLQSSSGEAIDAVSWGSDRTITDLPSPPAGQTLSRDLESLDFSVGEPTPGTAALRVDSSGPVQTLRIVEIFSNAGQGTRDAAFEWVEIFNPNDEDIDLVGWLIADNAGSDRLTGTVPGGGFAVIAGSEDAVDEGVTNVIVIDDGRIGNGLANGGDTVTLTDPAGRQVDRVDFSGPPLPRPEQGRSIARVDDVWILNLTPTPGESGAEPLLAALTNPPADVEQSTESSPSASVRQEDDEGGFPAWALVLIAVGVPVLAVAGRESWRRWPSIRGAR